MCAWRSSAIWPQVVAISLIGFGAASCSDSGRFSDVFGTDTSNHGAVTGSVTPASGGVVSRPLPPVAGTQGVSGGGTGMASYQPASGGVTGSVSPPPPPAPPPPRWTWVGGVPIIVAPGETVEMLSRKYHVPVSAIVQANNMPDGAVHAGQHLVIPRLRTPAVAAAPRAGRVASVPSTQPRSAVAPGSGVHVVAPGETLNSIARLYGKSVMVLAKANNIPPDTMVRVGERIVVPGVETKPRAEAPTPAHREIARIQTETPSPSSAWKATPVAPPAQTSPVKPVTTVGAVPSFRWPVHGHIIAGFGPSSNGAQNDGIDLAVPQGTPVKAADDGVVAYAGNELKGYGNLVLIRHDNGYVTAYAHASEILVKRGESVKRGQVIAKSGETGSVKAPELHFEIRKGATPVDPAQFLSGA
ncbi:MAG: LysM peptidoglycan-binding domain-containing M23 family metallopeptidase [Xanthobacteraceae bacterium]